MGGERLDPKRLEPSPETTTIADQGLVIRRCSRGGSISLMLGGELDSYSSHLLEGRMRQEESDGCSKLVLDLSELEFVDSSGLRTLIEAAKRASAGGWRLDVVNARGRVRQVFDITDMDTLLEYCQRPPERSPR